MAPYHHMRQAERVSTFKIYLSNLPDSLQNTELKALFEEYGRTVECEVFKKNYAFVHMEEEVCGRSAVSGLNRKEIDGKVISVSVSKNLEPPNIAKTRLSVKNLPLNMNAVGLRKLFQKFGLVLEAEITKSGDGIVSLEATGDIRTAINEISAMEMEGKKLHVEAVKVNLKAEKYGHPPSQMDWNPKPARGGGGGYSQNYRQESRPPPSGHYALGGGYSAQAQAEEFYGHQQEEYYEDEEEYYEEDYYPPAVYPPPEYEAPVRRYAMVPPPSRSQYGASRGRGNPVLRAGVDFMRRGDTEYYDDEPIEASYGMRQSEQSHMVSRNPVRPLGSGYGGQPPRGFGGGGRGGSRGRGRGGPIHHAPIPIPKRKMVRGEPYPSPPVPNPRMLLGQGRGGMRPRAPFMTRGGGGGGGGPIPKRGGTQRPSLLASARAAAAAQAAATSSNASGSYGGAEADPFGPSAAEKRYFQQQEQKHSVQDSSIDFTADIMLT